MIFPVDIFPGLLNQYMAVAWGGGERALGR